MKRSRLYVIFLVTTMLCTVSCQKRLVPAIVSGKKGRNYDNAAFNYVYVEAIKQKLMGNVGDALNYFEQCLKINPDSDASYYQMAQIMTANGDIKSGQRFAEKALSIDPENLWYLVMLAGIQYQNNNIDSAVIYYERAVRLYPDKQNLQVTLGNLYSEKGNFDGAKIIFNSLDEKFGVNETYTLSGIKNMINAENYDEALLKAQLLLKEYPDEILYNGLLAEIYRGKGERERAMAVYNRLIERNPDNPQIQLSLCDFLISEESYDELFMLLNTVIISNRVAREDKIALMAQLIEIPELIKNYGNNMMLALMVLEANYPDDDIIQLLKPELLTKQGKVKDASVRLEEIIKNRPENYYAWEKLLLVYLELGDYGKLMTKGEECATRFNRSIIAKMLFANGAIENEKYSIALEELRKAEILAGDNKEIIIQVLTMRADVYYRMKDYTKTFEIFEEALIANNDDLTVLNNYAYYLAEQNIRLKEAEVMAKKVIEREKGITAYIDTYGWILYKRGKLKEAATVMEGLINSGEKPDAEWYEHYGFILKKQKKCTKAIEVWNIALKLDSSKANLIKEIESCLK